MSRDDARQPTDRALGMDRAITRRDFVQGVAAGGAGVLAAALWPEAAGSEPPAVPAQDAPGYYPPRLTGLRGSHPGSFEAAHSQRDGQLLPQVRELDEEYELVVVGAGLSGLAAAHFYRE